MTKKCEVCGKKDFHVHNKDVVTELFLPDSKNVICHCGQVATHMHKQNVIVHIHWGKYGEKVNKD